MTREEELQILQDFIEKNGVTQLPKDERGPEIEFSAWARNKKKIKKAKKVAKKANEE